MSDLKVCRICLRTEAKMYHYNLYQLKFYYEEVMALKLNEEDGLPKYFCFECATILHKFHRFKEKCYSGQKCLRDLVWRGPITYEAIYKVDRSQSSLTSHLKVITSSERIKTYITRDSKDTNEFFETEKVEKIENIELDYFSENSDPMNGFDEEKILEDTEMAFEGEKIKVDDKMDLEPFSPAAVYVDSEKSIIEIKCEEIKEKNHSAKNKWFNDGKKALDSKNWKKIILSEEEALKNFRARAEDKKYVSAAYKCKDCFKGFSKANILDRHIQLRHVESLGPFECRFCRMRFKLDCYLRKHIRQHYTKFECLLCNIIYPLENSAVLHDEYHSGVIRKCPYCNEEFRHSSTYYSHLRTHRSEHVCTLCGISFVSKLGLRQHKKVKHIINEIDSSDDDEEVNTYCERCNIRFETRKAYDNHLFQSTHHSGGENYELLEENRKVLGKKEQAKITKVLRKRSTDADDDFFKKTFSVKRKKYRRNRKKPSTCYQCGKSFETQAACWKHHLAEHPGTSFYPPTERYICEICGSSLAPGSIAMHQNMHTRETVHTCDTCGKQFHAVVGLKRHLLTHTGEKPFACSLCDKRFTQSNSMKLHYRTIHLKEPYPKRNRRKNKDEPKTADPEDSNSEEYSESSLPNIEAELPERDAGIKPVTDKPTHETLNYLTLT